MRLADDELRKLYQQGTAARSRTGCPSSEILGRAAAGELSRPEREQVADHLAACSDCAQEYRTVLSLEPWAESIAPRRTYAHWLWRPAPVAALATLALVAGVWIYRVRQTPVSAPQQVAAPAVTVLRPEKPQVKLPAASALVWRGEPGTGQEKFVEELGRALVPYRNDDFAEAARRLEPLTKKYPDAAEPQFYFGVCQLFLGQNAEAAGALRRAKELAQGPLIRDAAWYLSLAYQRAGQKELAMAELRKLCEDEGDFRASACAGLQELK